MMTLLPGDIVETTGAFSLFCQPIKSEEPLRHDTQLTTCQRNSILMILKIEQDKTTEQSDVIWLIYHGTIKYVWRRALESKIKCQITLNRSSF